MVDGSGTEDKPLKIPKEVWILVNHLFTKSCDQVRRLFSDNVLLLMVKESKGTCAFFLMFHVSECVPGGLVPDTRPAGGAAKHHRLSGHQHPRLPLYPCL